MQCDRARAAKLAALLTRLAVTALIAVAALGVVAPAARADGDPGSDVLVSQELFLPADAGASAGQQAQLADLVQSVNHDGFAIRVAVIAQPDDLGAVVALWRKPAAYARFLGIELSLAYKQRLLVVMPNGFGFNWPGHSNATASRLLSKLPAGGGGSLIGDAEAAVQKLAAASGVTTASQSSATASSSVVGIPVTWAALLAALAAALLAAAAALTWRVRRRRTTDAVPRERVPLLRGHPWRLAASGVLAVAVVGAAGTAYAVTRPPDPTVSQEPRPSGVPASISTNLANEMAIDALASQAAPGFTLTDQAGRRLSLTGFRGKAVVLVFMDDHCTNICPIVSQEFVYAYHDLGKLASKAVFVGVNVNPFYLSQSAVAAFTNEHLLTAIPSWHYFTGTMSALRPVWASYHITVSAISAADVVHTSAVYVIDPSGRERYLADADVEVPEVRYYKDGSAYIPGGTEPAWGQGIAKLVRATLAGDHTAKVTGTRQS